MKVDFDTEALSSIVIERDKLPLLDALGQFLFDAKASAIIMGYKPENLMLQFTVDTETIKISVVTKKLIVTSTANYTRGIQTTDTVGKLRKV